QYSFGGIPFLFLGTNQIIFIIIILLYIFSGMAFASLSSETSLGVKVMEGNGKLPKVVLSSVDGSGGIPHCFPQFGPGAIKQYVLCMCISNINKCKSISNFIPIFYRFLGDAYFFSAKDGFARNMNWSIADSESVEGNPIITLEMKYDPYKCVLCGTSASKLYTRSIPFYYFNLLSNVAFKLIFTPDPKLRSHFFILFSGYTEY
ncbi:hypothetical protein IFM89_019672, partial [Coptis chinensis]